ncbi:MULTISPECIES: type II secretion system F family protein [unclassified Leucobacter]|uniref:type II secretion system F family protein n=1 Tax=unclassified Leucobacter TaxID=2621730 RepID=UPI00165D7E5B|nr:type II secretion system F family protein [Leucobacter sp. cx-87]
MNGRGSRRRGLLPWPGKRAPASGVVAAAFALRSATLLRGGVPLGRILSVIARGPGPPTPAVGPARGGGDLDPADASVADELRLVARRASRRVAGGASMADAVAGENHPSWRVLAAALLVAERSGAPQAAAMERMSESLSAIESAAERRRVLLTGPRATIALVGSLPLLAAACGALLGFDPFGVLFGATGAFLIPAGVGLLAAGVAWASALVRRIERSQRIVGVELELTWIALQGGGPPGPALRLVADAGAKVAAEWVSADALVAGGPTRRALATASATGVAAGPLLLAEAVGERERSLRTLERAAERLGVTILLPIGTCVLPAFVVLGVIPVLIAMLGGV